MNIGFGVCMRVRTVRAEGVALVASQPATQRHRHDLERVGHDLARIWSAPATTAPPAHRPRQLTGDCPRIAPRANQRDGAAPASTRNAESGAEPGPDARPRT